MTNTEFSNEFDILASSYYTEGGFTVSDSSILAFNEYEKSLFLTQAEEKYVLSLYNGKNPLGDSFEKTEEMRRYLQNLVAEYYTNEPLKITGKGRVKNYLGKDFNGMSTQGTPFKSTMFSLPEDLWFITYESVETSKDETKPDCDGGLSIVQDVIPVTQDEFHRIKRNPFRGPSYRRALRLDLSDRMADTSNTLTPIPQSDVVEIVSKYDISSYYVRYVKRLEPIILIDLPDSLSINGQTKAHECMLHEAVHRDILELAVRLAISSRSTTSKSKDNNN